MEEQEKKQRSQRIQGNMPKQASLATILFMFNIILLAGGIACVGIGTVYALKTSTLRVIKGFVEAFHIDIISFGLIAIGAITFVTNVVGFVAVAEENKYFAIVYSVFLTILLILSVSLCVYVAKSNQKVLKDYVYVKLRKIWTSDHKRVVVNRDNLEGCVVDHIQKKFRCCGVTGPHNYNAHTGNSTLPVSCCPQEQPKCLYPSAYKQGCNKSIKGKLLRYSHLITYPPIIITGYEAFVYVFAICYAAILACSSKIPDNENFTSESFVW